MALQSPIPPIQQECPTTILRDDDLRHSSQLHWFHRHRHLCRHRRPQMAWHQPIRSWRKVRLFCKTTCNNSNAPRVWCPPTFGWPWDVYSRCKVLRLQLPLPTTTMSTELHRALLAITTKRLDSAMVKGSLTMACTHHQSARACIIFGG